MTITDTMFTPVLDKDLICGSSRYSGSFGPLGLGGMCVNPYANTSFLGGISMPPALTSDVYGSVQRMKIRNAANITTVLTGLGVAALTLFAGSKISKLFKNFGKLKK